VKEAEYLCQAAREATEAREAACMETVRRRRIGRGERHADVMMGINKRP